ncbi:hypothetical protein Acsp06_54240 [Actinomycetospora sp. NBRC 106375]|nr:hypothetical protein Acsp06_54240 [Actinomycetospora sp. NBRC 106375]
MAWSTADINPPIAAGKPWPTGVPMNSTKATSENTTAPAADRVLAQMNAPRIANKIKSPTLDIRKRPLRRLLTQVRR